MRDKWIRFGCFLTGYNYNILKGCSESATKRVLRYTSALLIICVVWAFIGYAFTDRYLKGEWYLALLGAVIMVVLVVQIERQVILAQTSNKTPFVFRGIIAFVMALIGSVILDQIIFKEDIEQQKIIVIGEKVDEVFARKAKELKRQIHELDSIILDKENERKQLAGEVSKSPMIPSFSKQTTTEQLSDTTSTTKVTYVTTQIPNPKIEFITSVEKQIEERRHEKNKKDSILLRLRPEVEAELRTHVGFLDELEVMLSLVKKSATALVVWALWIVFFFGIELFILVSKAYETETDYEVMIKQQLDLHFRRIRLLGEQ